LKRGETEKSIPGMRQIVPFLQHPSGKSSRTL